MMKFKRHSESHMHRPDSGSKEWQLIEKALLESHAEQRRSRRWGIFFKSLTFVYLFVLLWAIRMPMMQQEGSISADNFAAVIEINGPIAAQQDANADAIIHAIREAFDHEGAKGLILRINSPGGSPVQAGYVYDEIQRLKQNKPDFPVYAVISDIGASGAYYIAAAADEIYADKASLVGSIGVIGSGFGFEGAMKKLGIERRLYTAGEHKAFLDPFSPEVPEEKEFWNGVLKLTHQQFIDQVKKGRGDRLQVTPDVFSGLIWTGEQALEMGLIDGLGSASFVARTQLDTEELVNFTYQPEPWERLVKEFGASVGHGVMSVLANPSMNLR